MEAKLQGTFSQLKYERADVAKMTRELKKTLAQFNGAENYQKARECYLKIDKLLGAAQTAGTVAHVRNSINLADKFYEKEANYYNAAFAKLIPLSKKMYKAMLESRFRVDFENEFGEIFIKKLNAQYTLANNKLILPTIRVEKLKNEFNKAVAACSCEFRGEKCNFYGLLKHIQSTDRQERKEAFLAWAKLYEDVSPKLDEIFSKLVKLRAGMAKKAGFESFTKMSYLQRERFDYDEKDVAEFRENVLKYITPACEKLYEQQAKRLGVDKLRFYDEQLVFPEGNAVPKGGKDELVAAARTMYGELSPETGEFFDFMSEHELFDLETRQNKRMGGYCTMLGEYKAPFIFSNFNGTSADVDVLTHEAGHAFEAYVASRIQPIADFVFSTSEIDEIHSMTMEHFTYPWMEKFFGENTEKYLYLHLSQALEVIPYMCCVDEYQHRVYENIAMTAMERRAVWREIEKKYMPWRDYDGNEFLEKGGFWMQKQHIFLYPFYYIDYALAQTCAFQLYIRMREDRDAAWQDYLRLCRAGGSKGYFELLKVANLENPFKEETMKEVTQKVMEALSYSDAVK